jgi:hypothetical protein
LIAIDSDWKDQIGIIIIITGDEGSDSGVVACYCALCEYNLRLFYYRLGLWYAVTQGNHS